MTIRVAAILAAVVLRAAVAGSVAFAVDQATQGSDEAPVEVHHKVPPDVGDFDAIEVPEGLTYRGAVVLELRRGTVAVPKAYGVFWGAGDLPCGYGLEIDLPGGTKVCFDEDHGEVEVRNKAPADRDLMRAILASAASYKLRPSRTTGELP
ncbi:MAG: hypothetical protein IT304_02910 [Dehalococcoidia bacterium]|nr:hypothetical protein [Dehalococcoidia bacterium]